MFGTARQRLLAAVVCGGGLALGWNAGGARAGDAGVEPVNAAALAATAPAADQAVPQILLAAGAPAPGGTGPATQPSTPPSRTAEQRRQDDINRAMEFFRITQPDVYEKALEMRKTDKANFDKLIMNAMPTVNHLEQVRKKNPKLFELSMKDLQIGYMSLQISHDLKRENLPDADRAKLIKQLSGLVHESFEVRQQIRQMEIDDLKIRLADLEMQVQEREKEREKRIGERVDDLIKNNGKLEW